MIRLKNILTENMRRFKTKNLSEQYDLDSELYGLWEKVPDNPYNEGDLIVAEKDGKYYSATGIFDASGDDLDYVNDIEEIDKDKYLKLVGEYSDQTNNQAPQDNMIDIKGSAPYYTAVYRHEGKNYKIEFEDYELMDQVDDYAWSGELLGVDQEGGEWAVMCQAVTLGGGDYDWEVDWDTMQYQGKPKPKNENKMKLKDLIPEQIKTTNDYDIMINYVEYDTNFRNSTLTFNKAEILTPENAEEIILQINDEVESENIRDDETGEYQYDITRIDGNIKFDCYIDTKSGQIDLTVTYSDEGMLEDVDINDQVIADKYGITEMDIANRLQ